MSLPKHIGKQQSFFVAKYIFLFHFWIWPSSPIHKLKKFVKTKHFCWNSHFKLNQSTKCFFIFVLNYEIYVINLELNYGTRLFLCTSAFKRSLFLPWLNKYSMWHYFGGIMKLQFDEKSEVKTHILEKKLKLENYEKGKWNRNYKDSPDSS